MSESLTTKLTGLLKTDPRFIDEDGELVKSAAIDRVWRTDREPIALLLSDPTVKTTFFEEIAGHWMFNAGEFVDYVGDKNTLYVNASDLVDADFAIPETERALMRQFLKKDQSDRADRSDRSDRADRADLGEVVP